MSDKVEAIRANIRENGHEACPSVGDVEHLLAALDAATALNRELEKALHRACSCRPGGGYCPACHELYVLKNRLTQPPTAGSRDA